MTLPVRDMTTLDYDLPAAENVGMEGVWVLPGDDEPIEIHGVFLGVATTRQSHRHPGRNYARTDQGCRGCRWFEPRIFRELKGQQRFLVHMAGMTVVPGEDLRIQHDWALSGHEVIEILLRREPGEDPYLSKPAGRVLAQAAAFDDDLHDAWVNRAVE